MDLLDGLRDHPFVQAMAEEDFLSFFEAACSLASMESQYLSTLPLELQRHLGEIKDGVMGLRDALRDERDR